MRSRQKQRLELANELDFIPQNGIEKKNKDVNFEKLTGEVVENKGSD